MTNIKNFQTYLFLSPQKFIISVNSNLDLKELYLKEENNLNETNQLDFKLIDEFLGKNIFEIEKKVKNFINNINIIIQSKDFFIFKISIKKKNYGDIITKDKLVSLLIEAKDECKKTIGDRKLVHMIIDNYFIDDKKFSFFPHDLKCKNLSIDINFICLSKKYIIQIEKILKNYQISIKNILFSEYVESFPRTNKEDMFKMSSKLIDGYNENEVIVIPKVTDNKGFFERFFNLFT